MAPMWRWGATRRKELPSSEEEGKEERECCSSLLGLQTGEDVKGHTGQKGAGRKESVVCEM